MKNVTGLPSWLNIASIIAPPALHSNWNTLLKYGSDMTSSQSPSSNSQMTTLCCCPLESPLLHILCKRCTNQAEILNEFPIEYFQTMKDSHIKYAFRCWPFQNVPYLVGFHLQAFFGITKPKYANSFRNVHFLKFINIFSSFNRCNTFFMCSEVFFLALSKDQYVIQVHDNKLP